MLQKLLVTDDVILVMLTLFLQKNKTTESVIQNTLQEKKVKKQERKESIFVTFETEKFLLFGVKKTFSARKQRDEVYTFFEQQKLFSQLKEET